MWTCPKCGEKIEDQFDSCWKCASGQNEAARGGPAASADQQDAAPLPSRYEFSEEQEETISKLASSMGWFSAIIFICGLLQCLASLTRGLAGMGGLASGIFCLATGWLTHSASKEFSSITSTQGDDIPHLMKGLRALSLVYRIQLWVIVAAVGLILLVFASAVGRR